MFASSGIPDPSQLIEAGKWTWMDFVDVGRKLTKDTNGDGKPETFGLQYVGTSVMDWVTKIRQNGGDALDESYKRVPVDRPEAIEGLQYWSDLSLEYNIAPKGSQSGPFDSKKSAVTGGWLSEAVTWKEAYRKRGIDMQLTLLPAGKAGYVTVAGGCPVCVSAKSKNAKEAYRLAKWFAVESDEWRITGTAASKTAFEGAYLDYLSEYFTDPGTAYARRC